MPRNRPHNALLLASALALCSTSALALDQAESQKTAKDLNNRASDDSLESSFSNGMRAAANLWQFNIPGAVQHGVKAYGQYQNSQELDSLKEKNAKLASSLSAVGSEAATVTGKTGPYVSPYSRLDKKFLYKGDVGEIAKKMEEVSGFSRERIFQFAVDTHTNSKSFSDPEFVPWARKTFHDIMAKTPEGEMKSKLLKLADIGETMNKSGAAVSMITKAYRALTGGASGVAASETPAANVAAASPDPTVAPVAEEPSDRAAASSENPDYKPGFERVSFDPVDGYLADLMKNADGKDNRTIFQVVSHKIKEVSVKQGLQKHP